ncbi:MAG: hypothetical protein WDO68_16690 [Gammaproteobacteria bacterium]
MVAIMGVSGCAASTDECEGSTYQWVRQNISVGLPRDDVLTRLKQNSLEYQIANSDEIRRGRDAERYSGMQEIVLVAQTGSDKARGDVLPIVKQGEVSEIGIDTHAVVVFVGCRKRNVGP